MKVFNSAILAGALVALSVGANATPTEIAIGVSQAGVSGGAITTEATGTTPLFGNYSTGVSSLTYGSFALNNISGTGTTAPATDVSNSINLTDNTAGTIDIYITQTGVTAPINLATFDSSFSTNIVPAGMTVTEYTYIDAGNGLYATTTLLSSATLTSLGKFDQLDNINVGSGPYSVTDEFVVTATAGIQGSETNSTIDLSTVVPEPGTLALLGAGLVGLGFVRRRGISFRF